MCLIHFRLPSHSAHAAHACSGCEGQIDESTGIRIYPYGYVYVLYVYPVCIFVCMFMLAMDLEVGLVFLAIDCDDL